jgi:hypothetical protein
LAVPFDRNNFDPDTVFLMNRVLKAVIDEQSNLAHDNPRRVAIAWRIMSTVAQGERDFEALKRAALDQR